MKYDNTSNKPRSILKLKKTGIFVIKLLYKQEQPKDSIELEYMKQFAYKMAKGNGFMANILYELMLRSKQANLNMHFTVPADGEPKIIETDKKSDEDDDLPYEI